MPGEGGSGGGGGATVGGHPGGPAQSTSHWLRQDTTVESCTGPGCPTAGQPQLPEPANSHGAHELLFSPALSSYAMNMHLDPERAPLLKQ